MKYLIIAALSAMLASCAGLDGTTLKFEGGVVSITPPPAPIVIPVDVQSSK
jgi:hypothetical protein